MRTTALLVSLGLLAPLAAIILKLPADSFASQQSFFWHAARVSVADILVLPSLVVVVLLCLLLGYVIYQSGLKRGLAIALVASYVAVVGFVSTSSMDLRPLSRTTLRDVEISQVLYVVSLFALLLVPITSLMVWLIRNR